MKDDPYCPKNWRFKVQFVDETDEAQVRTLVAQIFGVSVAMNCKIVAGSRKGCCRTTAKTTIVEPGWQSKGFRVYVPERTP